MAPPAAPHSAETETDSPTPPTPPPGNPPPHEAADPPPTGSRPEAWVSERTPRSGPALYRGCTTKGGGRSPPAPARLFQAADRGGSSCPRCPVRREPPVQIGRAHV